MIKRDENTEVKWNWWTRKEAKENIGRERKWPINSKKIKTSITESITYIVFFFFFNAQITM